MLYLFDPNINIIFTKLPNTNKIRLCKCKCYNIELHNNEISKSSLRNFSLCKTWITYAELQRKVHLTYPVTDMVRIEIGPILSIRTAWSTNFDNICRKSNMKHVIARMEQSTVYLVALEDLVTNKLSFEELSQHLFQVFHDKMTHQIYRNQMAFSENTPDHLLESKPKYQYYVDLFQNVSSPLSQNYSSLIQQVNQDFGLSLELSDLDFIQENILQWNNPLFTILDLAQSNSEHCRHHFFNGKIIKDGIPTLGTCAGLILLSKEVVDGNTSLNILESVVERNAYGRQNQSFEGLVEFNTNKELYCFIRAPKILNISSNVEKICFIGDEIVGIKQDNVVGLTFHPELTNDEYYLKWLKSFLKEGINVRSF